MISALLLTSVLSAQDVAAPQVPVDTTPKIAWARPLPGWAVDVLVKVKAHLPSPLGWAGLAGLGLSGVVIAVGLAVTAASALQIFRGKAQQDAFDRAASTGTPPSLQGSRDAFNLARVLSLFGAGVLLAGMVGSAAAALVVIVDETFFVPALKSRHPFWTILGPIMGERDPAPMWPPVPRPPIPGVFTPPVDTAPPAPVAPPPPSTEPTTLAPLPDTAAPEVTPP